MESENPDIAAKIRWFELVRVKNIIRKGNALLWHINEKPPESGLSIHPRKRLAILGGTANSNHVLVNEIRVR